VEGFSHGTDAISAAGMAGSLADLFSIYNCPATNITAANAIANIALANWGTSFILCFHRNTTDQTGFRESRTLVRRIKFRGVTPLKCRSCRTPPYSPPVHMIKANRNARDYALCLGASGRGEVKAAVRKIRRSYPVHYIQSIGVRRYSHRGNPFCQKQRNDQADAAKDNNGF
jgi:hypothetical protein